LVKCRVQATDSQVFQEDVAFTAAPNSHLRLYFKAAHCTSHVWELQPGNSAAARIDGFFNVQFTATRRRKRDGPGSSRLRVKGEVCMTEEQLIASGEQMLRDRPARADTVATAMIIA